ncbi:hypothetical protein B0T10DRAFT_611840 [Thelonectria olida]|uniref:Uncharacterized protein n=1 Tax=Thelonectria olida TaxID=1576542 RepID=A0A9P9AH76_9HYPO|nr:hypothetical protein B0T10DRAFT_611840 [Thelonectria olida]
MATAIPNANGRQQSFCCDAPGKKNQPFLPVDLDKIFPSEYLPPPDAVPEFELINIRGGSYKSHPDEPSVAFFLLPDCPEDPLGKPLEEAQTARVICLNHKFEKCFGVAMDGVEGTIVHMPECGQGTYAGLSPLCHRKTSRFRRQSPWKTFSFDYNLALERRDAGELSIRMDYSNVRGYWNAAVDTEGKKKRDLEELVARFY